MSISPRVRFDRPSPDSVPDPTGARACLDHVQFFIFFHNRPGVRHKRLGVWRTLDRLVDKGWGCFWDGELPDERRLSDKDAPEPVPDPPDELLDFWDVCLRLL